MATIKHAVQIDGRTAYWWTFAGGRVNHTLKYGFEVLEGEVVTERARAVKGPDEIRAMRCAHNACESAIAEMELRDVRPEVSDGPVRTGTRLRPRGRTSGN